MVNLEVSPTFQGFYGKLFGIPSGEALNAAKHHDAFELLHIDGLEARVYVKRNHSAKGPLRTMRRSPSLQWRATLDASLNTDAPTFLIVVEDGGVIRCALRVYDDLHPRLAAQTPVDMLGLIVERVGLELQIGETRSKFIFNERIHLSKRGRRSAIRSVSRSPSLNQWLWKLDSGPPRVAICNLCFSVDTDAYRQYLRRHTRVKGADGDTNSTAAGSHKSMLIHE